MPKEDRQSLNEMLRDGLPYTAILKKFANKKYNLNEDVLSRWYSGGYQDWLDEQACLDEMRVRLDFASDVVTHPNANRLTEASLRVALLRMYNLLLDFDPIDFKEALSTSPGLYAKILDSVCKLTSGAIKQEKHRIMNTPISLW
jgi:hypothetical protein